MVIYPQALLLATVSLWGHGAGAQCGCLCVEGTWRTVCSDLQQARETADLCVSRDPSSCPAALAPPGQEVYESPDAGATNCRDARVWDVSVSAYTTRKICDLGEAG